MRSVVHTDPITGRVERATVDRQGRKCPKFAYTTKKAALHMAATQSRASGENIRAYHCFACHCFHIGHPPGNRGGHS